MTVLDSSALLVFLFGGRGNEVVKGNLEGSAIGAANWSEVLTKIEGSVERSLVESLLFAFGLVIEPVTRADATRAAIIHQSNPSLSLGDRLCLALGERLEADVLTADRAWGNVNGIIQIRT